MRKLIGACVFFSIGFIVHALFFPNFLYRGLDVLTQKESPSTPAELHDNVTSSSFSLVAFDGKQFNPPVANVNFGQYISITNKTKDKPMWLISNQTELNTKRPYGESERLAVIIQEEGTYVVTDKNTQAKLTVIVKKVVF